MDITMKAHALINDMGSDLRDNIIMLDQKLKGLRAEINAKIESFILLKTANQEESIKKLTNTSEEITIALSSIEHIVNMVSSSDSETTARFLKSKAMKQFGNTIAESLEKIIEIKSKL